MDRIRPRRQLEKTAVDLQIVSKEGGGSLRLRLAGRKFPRELCLRRGSTAGCQEAWLTRAEAKKTLGAAAANGLT